MNGLFAIFWIFLKLGCRSFGGPIAHLGYFQQEFVERRQWLSAAEYAELIALCNFLPGPASSQVGMALGYRQRGVWGSLAAFTGFTLPSATLMLLMGYLLLTDLSADLTAMLHGLKLLAVVVVAYALRQMLASLAVDQPRQLLVLAICILTLLLNSALVQLLLLVLAGLMGVLFLSAPANRATSQNTTQSFTSVPSYIWLSIYAAGLLLLPLLSYYQPHLGWIDSLYRVGATVMGGGHVVLPLLSAESAITDHLGSDLFLAGYSLAQAVPGPMFTLASYLGVTLSHSLWGGILATVLIFLPGWLLLMAVLPLWSRLRQQPTIMRFVHGIHLGVIGLLMATLYQYVWQGSVSGVADVAVVLVLWALHINLRCSIGWVIPIAATLGWLVGH